MSFLTSSPSQIPPMPSTTSSFTVISNNNSRESHQNQDKENVQNMECKLQDRTEFLNTEQTGNKNMPTQKCNMESFASPSSNASCGTENLQSSSVSQFTSSHMLYNAHFGSAPVAVYNKSNSSNNNNNTINNNNNTNNSSSISNNNSFNVFTTNNLNSNYVNTNTTPSSVNTIVSSDISPLSTSSSPAISPTTAKFAARFGQSTSDNAQQELHQSTRVPTDRVNMNQYCNNSTTNNNVTNSNFSSINNSPSDNGNSSDNNCNTTHTYEENEKMEMSAEQNMAMLYSPLGVNNKKYKNNFNIDANDERNKSPYASVGMFANSNTTNKVANLQSHFGDGQFSNYASTSNTTDNNTCSSNDNVNSNVNIGNCYRSSSKSYFSVNDQNNNSHSSDNDRNELSTNPFINIRSCNSNHLPRSVSSYSQGSNDDLQVGERPRIVSSTPSSPRFATRFATDDFIALSHHHLNSNNINNTSVSCLHYDSNMAANRIMSNDVNLNTQNMISINADTSPSSSFAILPSSSPFLYINDVPTPTSNPNSISSSPSLTPVTMDNNHIYTSNNPPSMLESTCQFVRSPSTHSFTADNNNNVINTTNNTLIITNNDSNNNNNSFVLTRSESASREEVCYEPTIEVYDPDFKDILTIRISHIFHRPHPSFGVSRLVLCRNFSIDNPNGCTKRDLCKFVHADTRNATRNSIHVNYAWRSLEECTYTRLPAGEELVVLAPNERPPSELIASERILLTRGSANWKEHSSPLSHCAHYYFNRMCNRGERCNFIHTVYVDPSVQGSFKRAPAPTAVAPILAKPTLPSTNTTPNVVIPNNLPATASAIIVTPQGLPMQSQTLTIPFTSSSCVQAASPQSVMLLHASPCTSFNPVAVPVTLTSPSHGIASSASSLNNCAAANTPCSLQSLQALSLQHPSIQTSPLLCPSMTHSPVQPAPLPAQLQSLSTLYVAPMSSTPSSSRSPVSTSELTPSHSPLMMVMNPMPSTNLSIMPMPQPMWGVNAQTNQPINAIQQFTLPTQQSNYLHGANNDLSQFSNVAVSQNNQIAELTSQTRMWENGKIEELTNDNQFQKTLKECYSELNNGYVDSNNLNAGQGNCSNSNINENQININSVQYNITSNNNKNNADNDDHAENRIKANNLEMDKNNGEEKDVNQLDKIASLLSADNDQIEWLTPISQHSETTSSMGQIDWSFYGDLDDEPFVPASDEIYDIIDDALRNNDVETNTGESDSDTDNK